MKKNVYIKEKVTPSVSKTYAISHTGFNSMGLFQDPTFFTDSLNKAKAYVTRVLHRHGKVNIDKDIRQFLRDAQANKKASIYKKDGIYYFNIIMQSI